MDIFSPFIFEVVMLLCFGCSWPFAIAKTIRTRSVEGLSIWFISLIFLGYLAGILYKLIALYDGVIWLYITNGSMIFTQILLYFRYRNARSYTAAQAAFCVERNSYPTNNNSKGEAYDS